MTAKNNCDKWIDFTYNNWLNWLRFKKGKSDLRGSSRNLIDRLKSASLDPSRNEEAWNLLERLKRLSESFNDLENNSRPDGPNSEYAEVYLECALAAYKMGDIHEAQELIAISVSRFPIRSIHKALSLWLRGCIQWQLPSHLEDAIISWEQGLKIVSDAELDNRNDQEIRVWCKQAKEEMKNAINYGSLNNTPPIPPSYGARAETKKHILQTLPVIGQIPAGMPSDVLPVNEDYINITKVSINNKDYRIVSLLRGENFVNIPPESCFYVLRVTGNSMNQCSPEPIEDGSYVILRKQNQADSGEIVAAQIVKDQGEGERLATLKRYLLKDGKVVLKPESDDPNFQKPIYMNRVFNKLDEEFRIRGVAIAVLKPL